MTDVTAKNFGYVVAYVIPGFIVVAGVGVHSRMVAAWLGGAPWASPTVGGFLYVTLASIATGMAVSAFRWLILDEIHHRTGVPRPAWNVSTLPANLSAFNTFVEYHYRHYQFYGNTLIALFVSLASWPSLQQLLPLPPVILAVVMLCLIALFFVASRDALTKYYARTNSLLHNSKFERIAAMVNGCHPEKRPEKSEPVKTETKRPQAAATTSQETKQESKQSEK